MKINDRLKTLQKQANLTISDMGVWFHTQRRTMETWLSGTMPHPVKREQLHAVADLLEKAIKSGKHFPVPLDVTQYKRRSYIEKVRDAVTDRVSSARSTERRV